jgi:4-amino-4-deoxy-L-arabinose transferase-like glycosyltransferase
MSIDTLKLQSTKRKELLFLALCLFIGFSLRFYGFDHKSLWIDEVNTFNDSRDGLSGQIEFYKKNPTYLHPPLFFILTHLFYPFTTPERDLRIIPLIFGTLSIPMIYLMSRLFSHNIAIPCTLSLTFMVYHIYFSQEGRPYSFLMFLGMTALYFFIKHLITLKKRYLLLVSILFTTLFLTNYTAILFVAFSQILWFYKIDEDHQKPPISSFFLLNGLFLLFSGPWFLFLALNYRGQLITELQHPEAPGSFASILYWVLNDWVSNLPLIILSAVILILWPFFSERKNALVLLAVLIFPIGSFYLFCKLLNVTHFFSSKYLVAFLPLFLISLYLSLNAIEIRFQRLIKYVRLKLLFTIFLIVSNALTLPLYYRSEKQDFRSLVAYLKAQVRDGDKIVVLGSGAHLLGMLHYFGVYPEERVYLLPARKVSEKEIEYRVFLRNQNRNFMLSNSSTYWFRYLEEQNRVWIVIGKAGAKHFEGDPRFILKAYFDGSYLNFDKFPTDASMYLFLCDPKSTPRNGPTRREQAQ